MKRRDFIKYTAVLSAANFLPHWALARSVNNTRPVLPIPPLLTPDAQSEISLILQSGKSCFSADTLTTTWGINGPLLGPALRLQRGKTVKINVKNKLKQDTTLHWHGVEVPGDADGGPQATIAPNGQWHTQFTVDQPAATCWFHPHTHHKTGQQVAMGLGGLILIDDPDMPVASLPARWGEDDIPVILQDKRLNKNAEIDYQLDVISAAVGWFGDVMLTNGTPHPRHIAPRGWLRLRLLNGCNARSLCISTSDKRPLYVIASDGGLLAEPVKLTALPLLMGERFEVLVDTRDGKAFDIITLPVRQMGMTLPPFDRPLALLTIQPSLHPGQQQLPDTLAVMPTLPTTTSLPQRLLKLSMDPRIDRLGMEGLMARYGHQSMAGFSMEGHATDTMKGMSMEEGPLEPNMEMHHHGHSSMKMSGPQPQQKPLDLRQSNFINEKVFDMHQPMFDVKRGQYEKWVISGEGDMMMHPFHIHGTQFRILSENGIPPATHRSGWKDTVQVEGAKSEVLVRFNHLADATRPYMAHCHLLEHEDTGMMMSFTVSA